MDGMVMRMDTLGRPAWIAAMVVGFVLFWPVGLAILAYMIFSGRMGCRRFAGPAETSGFWHGNARRDQENHMGMMQDRMERMQEKMARWGNCRNGRGAHGAFAPSGNRAFDEYRSETIRRLEDEAGEFRSFLERLRHAKDKAEFDQFMADRRERNDTPPAESPKDGAPRDDRPQVG
jgi:hypothetical protein